MTEFFYNSSLHKLRVTVHNSVAITFDIFYQTLDEQSQQHREQQKTNVIPSTSNGSAYVTDLELDQGPQKKGFLMNVALNLQTASITRGRVWTRGEIRSKADNRIVQVLWADYLTSKSPVGFPFSPIGKSTDGRGWFNTVATDNPVSGVASYADISVPVNRIWRLIGFQYQLSTSAIVANRYANLILYPTGTQAIHVTSGLAIPAGMSSVLSLFTALDGDSREHVVGTTRRQCIPMGDIFLSPGALIQAEVRGFDVDDNLGVGSYHYEEWIID